MNQKKLVYATLVAVFICSVVFLGCPTAEEMADDVITPSDGTPPPPPEEDTPPPPPPEEDTPPPPPPEEDTPPPPPPVGNPTVFAASPEAWWTDHYNLESAMLVGDTLTINVAYGGGCEDHEFTLIASETFMESDPVELSVSIVHNANNDPCERWVEEAYHFDLTPIKTKYQQVYQQDAGTIMLNLANLPEGYPALNYEFAE